MRVSVRIKASADGLPFTELFRGGPKACVQQADRAPDDRLRAVDGTVGQRRREGAKVGRVHGRAIAMKQNGETTHRRPSHATSTRQSVAIKE